MQGRDKLEANIFENAKSVFLLVDVDVGVVDVVNVVKGHIYQATFFGTKRFIKQIEETWGRWYALYWYWYVLVLVCTGTGMY